MWQNARGDHGFNFVNNNNDPMDDDGHGTHIAGLIAAEENNGFGVAGLTGDFVEIMAIKSLPTRQAGRTSDIYNGIEYAINNGADIISLSIYAEGLNPLLESAIIKAIQHNILVVLAIGNQSKKLSSQDPVAPAYIGAALNGAVTVASVDTVSGELSFFSNYGDKYAEVAAPGAENGGVRDQGLLSTLPGENWGRLRGTSQAAPIVSAMAARWISFLKSNNIFYTPEMLEKLILAKGTRSFETLSEKITQGRVINFKVMNENLDKDEVVAFLKSQKQEGLCSTNSLN
jgi:subtilisin family serine protease